MTTIRTPSDHILNKQSLAPQAIGTGATVNGTGVDTEGFEAGRLEVQAGAVVAGANQSVTVKIQQSSDDAASDPYADIALATTGAILNAGENEPYLIDINLSETERYLRAVATGGSSAGGLVSAAFNLMTARHSPPTQDNTVVETGYT